MTTPERALPGGTVTFLFTDIEASTRLLEDLGSKPYRDALMKHREAVRQAVTAHHGQEMGTEGDAFFIVFARASDAVAAGLAIQEALRGGPVRVRIGIHSGEPLIADGDYIGIDVHKAARICSAAHGGQTVISRAARDLARADVRDLGEHRLKDLSAPERLFQVGSGTFPPLRTLPRTNFPVQPTPLFGRERELGELFRLTRSNRLVTLTGPGGTGKTRLALELAAELADEYRDGGWWVPLAAISDPGLVLPTIVQAVGGRGEDAHEHLADRHLLLVLDNFEQVLPAAPLIAALLSSAPSVDVLATSRERLAIAGEQEYPVPPLTEEAARELFVTRARSLKPDFEPDDAVLEICRRLDRLPLALELASTRVKLMTPAQILSRLGQRLDLLTVGRRDAPPRQATMRAAITWSYDLLPEPERALFCRLAVFPGTFELEAAEAVCDADLDALQSLVDKSLLKQGADARFFLLETTREYARELLDADGEAEALRRRHAEWFLGLAQRARDHLRSAEQGTWLQRVWSETDNFRAALGWALEKDVTRGVELAGTLFRAWMMQGRLPESISRLERALANPRVTDPLTRAHGLRALGEALFFTDQPERAQRVLEESRELFHEAGDEHGEGLVLNLLGSVSSARGAHRGSIELRERALAIFRQLDDRGGIARSLHLLGEDLRDLGEFERGAAALEESLAIDTSLQDRYAVATTIHSLADLALDQRDLEGAARRYLDGLQIVCEIGDERGQAYCIAGLASVAALQGRPRLAGRLWGSAEAVERDLRLRFLTIERARYEQILDEIHHDPDFLAGCGDAAGIPIQSVARELLDGTSFGSPPPGGRGNG